MAILSDKTLKVSVYFIYSYTKLRQNVLSYITYSILFFFYYLIKNKLFIRCYLQ